MKRPELEVLLGAVPFSTVEFARRWLRFAVDSNGAALSNWYAHVVLDPSTQQHEWTDETLTLRGRDDLLVRIAADGSAAFTTRLPFGFANGDVTLLLLDASNGATAGVLVVESNITQFTETEPATRDHFVAKVLEGVETVGCPSMLVGMRLPWVPLSIELLMQRDGAESFRCAAAWRQGAIDQSEIIDAWQCKLDDIRTSVLGYEVLTRWP